MTTEERREKVSNLFIMARIPFTRLDHYGSQFVVVCLSQGAADKVEYIFRKAGYTIRGNIKSTETNKVNKNSFLLPSRHDVYKVFACV